MPGNIFLTPATSTAPSCGALLLHGLTASLTEVEPLAQHLVRQGYVVSAPLLSGHGTDINELRRTPTADWLGDAERSCLDLAARVERFAVVGESLGALLAIHLALFQADRIGALVLLSPPFKFRSRFRETFLPFLATQPDAVLDRLWLRPKRARPNDVFAFPHSHYSAHAVSSVVRLFQLRKRLTQSLGRVRCPTLVLQDPLDHHLHPESGRLLVERLGAEDKTLLSVEGGYHELLIGAKHDEVFRHISAFLSRVIGPACHAK